MKYIVGLRIGQNDIKALTNLESARKDAVIPLLSMRGDTQKELDKFINNWGGRPFFIDVSHYPGDTDSVFNQQKKLHDPARAFFGRQQFYKTVKSRSDQAVPVVSWQDNDNPRDIIQFALALSQQYPFIAIRPTIPMTDTSTQWPMAINILNAIQDLSKVWLIADFGYCDATFQSVALKKIEYIIKETAGLGLQGIAMLTTSYPTTKPPSGNTATIPCLDIGLYLSALKNTGIKNLVYADCAATNPTSTMDFIPGMPVIPFAGYFTPREWWQGRLGKSMETAKYVDLAKNIQALPGYHGDNFCWGTKEIGRIATGTSTTGSNGSWNGVRINQHICALLEHEANGGFSTSSASTDDDL